MPSQHSNEKKPNSGPSPEHKGYSTSEAILALKDDLLEEIKTGREQEPKADTTPKWIAYATLFLVFLTTAGLGIQDLILHSSDDTFKATLESQKNPANNSCELMSVWRPAMSRILASPTNSM